MFFTTSDAVGFRFYEDTPTNRSLPQSRTRGVILSKNKFNQKNALQVSARQSAEEIRCGCVPQGTCVASNTNTDGTGLIDFRIVTNVRLYLK